MSAFHAFVITASAAFSLGFISGAVVQWRKIRREYHLKPRNWIYHRGT